MKAVLFRIVPRLGRFLRGGALAHGLFWSWNLIFLVVVGLGLLPTFLWSMVRELYDGTLPASLALSGALLCIIPPLCTAVGLFCFLHDPRRLLRLFYGVEGPLVLLSLFRVFLLRELNPGLDYLIVLLSVCLVSYGYTLAFGEPLSPGWRGFLQYVGRTVAALCCVYAGAILLFYALPLGWWMLYHFLAFGWVRDFYDLIVRSHGQALIFAPLGALLLFFSATLLVAMPAVLVWLYGKSFLQAAREITTRHGPAAATLVATVTIGAGGFGFVQLTRQPQRAALSALSQPPRDDAGRRAMLASSESLRKGILNAYLAHYRYLSALGDDHHIVDIYHETFGLSREHGKPLQDLFNVLVSPVLYDGSSLHADRYEAEQDYEAFFDEPIQKGERPALRHASQATYERERREAGLLSTDERKVWIARQEVTVRESGDLAEVELHEIYENQTTEQQEIFYYFTLPESAAVTGLWLGNNEKDRFAFTVARRGAAQKVYKAEVRRGLDPALLEQVGPRQYRLRAFPIPPRPRLGEHGERAPAPRFHLWLTYRTFARDGTWPLPVLRERRNVYWSLRTERAYPTPRSAAAWLFDAWLPPSVDRQSSAQPTAHAATLGGFTVRATPPDRALLSRLDGLPEGQSFAVVLDRSRSMAHRAAEAAEGLGWLRRTIGAKNRVDLYLTSAKSRGEPPSMVDLAGFDPAKVLYYGGQKAGDLLQQFGTLRAGRTYRAILVLTDDGSLDLADDRDPVRDFAAPVYLVHLGGVLPPGYDDATLATLQKRGGAAVTTVSQAFVELAAASLPGFSGLDEGYLFTVGPGDTTVEAMAPKDDFAAIAARELVKYGMRTLDLSAAADLDRLHEVALHARVVTPYSSMIVLVNDRQREALRKAESEDDRFKRESESGSDQALVTGTPEPREWVLLFLCAAGMVFMYLRQRRLDPEVRSFV